MAVDVSTGGRDGRGDLLETAEKLVRLLGRDEELVAWKEGVSGGAREESADYALSRRGMTSKSIT